MSAQTAADKALTERDRLMRRYNTAKKQQFAELCADPVWGERLRKFAATLNHFGIDHAEEMIAYVKREARWLRHEAPDDIRFAALQAVDARIIRIRERAGLPVFDDALPGEEPDVFQICKAEIGL